MCGNIKSGCVLCVAQLIYVPRFFVKNLMRETGKRGSMLQGGNKKFTLQIKKGIKK